MEELKINAKAAEKFGARVFAMNTSEITEECFRENYGKLSEYRREKVNSCRFLKDKKLSLAAGMLLDSGLSQYGLREKDIKISLSEYGKPYLADYPDIHFNLSHSGEIALAVFAAAETGCDIEKIQPFHNGTAERFFSPSEREFIVSSEDSDRAFCRIWTLRESFSKAVGSGLSLPHNCFEIVINGGTIGVRQSLDSFEYAFCELDCAGYCGAVCFRRKIYAAV
ncbi:MAG: 4'-phosphopantetheinyl transferase superfamily protein [Ruminococcus sp.]|nr:4'-phosphopantetheinyl transferase superfamily protein [Ruminococcus sp.]